MTGFFNFFAVCFWISSGYSGFEFEHQVLCFQWVWDVWFGFSPFTFKVWGGFGFLVFKGLEQNGFWFLGYGYFNF
jgi:hypothetical protein